ncbi:hypothetical protein NEOKW01_1312 [Nematocida sp. AWRm80]|nr:hypothetical protein NEOKW01_1312 [Nematocida sp. AWRm80]
MNADARFKVIENNQENWALDAFMKLDNNTIQELIQMLCSTRYDKNLQETDQEVLAYLLSNTDFISNTPKEVQSQKFLVSDEIRGPFDYLMMDMSTDKQYTALLKDFNELFSLVCNKDTNYLLDEHIKIFLNKQNHYYEPQDNEIQTAFKTIKWKIKKFTESIVYKIKKQALPLELAVNDESTISSSYDATQNRANLQYIQYRRSIINYLTDSYRLSTIDIPLVELILKKYKEAQENKIISGKLECLPLIIYILKYEEKYQRTGCMSMNEYIQTLCIDANNYIQNAYANLTKSTKSTKFISEDSLTSPDPIDKNGKRPIIDYVQFIETMSILKTIAKYKDSIIEAEYPGYRPNLLSKPFVNPHRTIADNQKKLDAIYNREVFALEQYAYGFYTSPWGCIKYILNINNERDVVKKRQQKAIDLLAYVNIHIDTHQRASLKTDWLMSFSFQVLLFILAIFTTMIIESSFSTLTQSSSVVQVFATLGGIFILGGSLLLNVLLIFKQSIKKRQMSILELFKLDAVQLSIRMAVCLLVVLLIGLLLSKYAWIADSAFLLVMNIMVTIGLMILMYMDAQIRQNSAFFKQSWKKKKIHSHTIIALLLIVPFIIGILLNAIHLGHLPFIPSD